MVVGAGTVGGWAGWFASRIGARVTVLERHTAGQGASSRAAGMVRAQGGTPTAVALGRWTIDFYERQRSLIGTDSGFRRLGYLLVARNDQRRPRPGHAWRCSRPRASTCAGWTRTRPWRSTRRSLPAGSPAPPTAPIEGCIDPPRNVRAYMLALQQAGVELRERCECEELLVEDGRVVGVRAGGETIPCSRVILTGGPSLRDTARRLGFNVFAGGARHQVAVTSPHEAFAGDPLPMVFDVGAGIYWRQEEDGLLFGWSDPEERPGEAREVDWGYLERVRARLAADVPATAGLGLRKVWAATIDYTPDHLPILDSPVEGLVIASAAGHGMMWGPAVAKAAAQLALTGDTDVVDVSDLGLDRFDAEGRSRLATDPIALPFPAEAEDLPARG